MKHAFAGIALTCALAIAACREGVSGQTAGEAPGIQIVMERVEVEVAEGPAIPSPYPPGANSEPLGETVYVSVRWFVGGISDPLFALEHMPVYLNNYPQSIPLAPTSVTSRGNGFQFESRVNLALSHWQEGCWQAEYVLAGVHGDGEIRCVNAPPQ